MDFTCIFPTDAEWEAWENKKAQETELAQSEASDALSCYEEVMTEQEWHDFNEQFYRCHSASDFEDLAYDIREACADRSTPA